MFSQGFWIIFEENDERAILSSYYKKFGIQFGIQNINNYICQQQKNCTMEVISSRDFRSNQSKYLGMAAKGHGIIIKTRSLGSFKITPLTEDDTLMSKEEFFRKLDRAREEIKSGKGTLLKTKGDIDKFLESL